jgi:hypothetical protein
MNDFMARYQDQWNGVLSGFDLVFRGQFPLNHETGMKGYLSGHDLRLKDFGEHTEAISRKVKQACLAVMEKASRPVAVAGRAIARPTRSRFNGLRARLQTWFPVSITIFLNVREWLAQQRERSGMRYPPASELLHLGGGFGANTNADERANPGPLGTVFGPMGATVHPVFAELCQRSPMQYYWTSQDSEWAMDLVLGDAEQLRRLYPRLEHLAMTGFSSPDVLRFMGKPVRPDGTGGHILTAHPLRSDVHPSGVRIKHRLACQCC